MIDRKAKLGKLKNSPSCPDGFYGINKNRVAIATLTHKTIKLIKLNNINSPNLL